MEEEPHLVNPVPHRYFILYKPYNMVSQFVSSHPVRLLGDLGVDFPEGTHAIGRLDGHSEGLLLLTTNKKITRLLFQDETPHKRVYLVQVNNKVSGEKIERLRKGVELRIAGGQNWTSSPCEVERVDDPEKYCRLSPAVLVFPPYTWLLITLTEGKFHQVRKMMTAIQHKCKRLIRVGIEGIWLEEMEPGTVREIKEEEFFNRLNLRSSKKSG